MAKSSVLVSLPQMVDLALKSPEASSVNFNVLHSLLHVLIQQVDFEFIGNDSEKLQTLIASRKPGPSVNLTEYIVTPGVDQRKVIEKKNRYRKVRTDDTKKSTKEEVLIEPELKVIDQRKDSKEETSPAPFPISPPPPFEMAKSGVMVSLPQMVDLALNSPEVGAVNFNILHSLLHVLIQQVDLMDCQVEFVGNDSERLQRFMASSTPGPSLNLTEYIVTPGHDQHKVISKRNKYRKAKGSKDEIIIERELRVIDRRNNSKDEPNLNPAPLTPGLNTKTGSTLSMQTVVTVEKTASIKQDHVTVALSRAHFDDMEEEIRKIKDDINTLKELPDNMGLMQALRSAAIDKSSPVVDMFQILTLTKRIDAAEIGMEKLASMMQDLVKENSPPQLVTVLAPENRRSSSLTGGASPSEEDVVRVPNNLLSRIEEMDKRLDSLETILHDKIQDIQKKVAVTSSLMAVEAGAESRVTDLEQKLTNYTEQMATIDAIFNNQYEMLQNQLNDLEKEMGEIVERVNAGLSAGDNRDNLTDVYNKMGAMQVEVDKMADIANKLIEEKDERQATVDVIVEQVELLKCVKANREDLEDALADKADNCTVNRKVSHDQFDAACDDLSQGIEEALGKLMQQEKLWQGTLDNIQMEIESKLDKMELVPLRDFVTNKLKALQERLKALASLKKENEAAGTKSKYLRNVNCISCDKEVVMRKELDPKLITPYPSLPPTKSMAPYLAYEMDALRKQQKCMPNSRNMNHFENMMAGMKGAKGDDHICNRYCGGSHTVTTPQQRVARLGHFLQQWGPDSQIYEGQVRGTDGNMYKSRNSGASKGNKFSSVDADDDDGYLPVSKTRPSMMVQGGILTSRTDDRPSVKIELPKKTSVQRVSGAHKVSTDSTAKRVSAARSSLKKSSVRPHASKQLTTVAEDPEVAAETDEKPPSPPPDEEGLPPEEASEDERSLVDDGPPENPDDEALPDDDPLNDAPDDAPPVEDLE